MTRLMYCLPFVAIWTTAAALPAQASSSESEAALQSVSEVATLPVFGRGYRSYWGGYRRYWGGYRPYWGGYRSYYGGYRRYWCGYRPYWGRYRYGYQRYFRYGSPYGGRWGWSGRF